ncbi:MAG: CBS domain-containing protein [Coriobacteriia bacterium]
MKVAVGHANPDFDAYASTAAAVRLHPGTVGVFLGSQNAGVREFHNLHGDLLGFADLKDLDLDSVETVIMVDTREPRRIGELGAVVARRDVEVIVYDHHPPADGDVAADRDHSMEVGATTSILVHEMAAAGIEPSPLEATTFLLGIHEDTGSLTFPNTTAYDAEAVWYLMGCGADLEVLGRFLEHPLTASQRALLERLIGGLEIWGINGQEIAVATARTDEYVDSASLVTHYLSTQMGYRVAFAVIEMPERVYIVGRSRIPQVDVGGALGHLGGGGHSQAASASVEGADMRDLLDRLRAALESEVEPPLTAGQIASSPVKTVSPETTMAEAGRLMQTWGHGGLPVVEDGRLVGLVTRKAVDKALRHGLSHAPVKGFMGHGAVTIGPDTDVGTIERIMTRESVGRLPVVVGDEIVGIVTRKDVLRAQHGDEYLQQEPAREQDARRAFTESVERLLPEEDRRLMRYLGELASEMDLRAYVVGGFVRDMLLGVANLDMDIVVEGDGVAFAQRAAERLSGRVVVHRRFGTAVLVLPESRHVDIASARTEYYQAPGALPTVESSSLHQDLYRRDFSINAMAARIWPERFGEILDPFGGLRDLRAGVLRVLHALSFIEDPTRVFRAARFEQRYGFAMERSTERLARECVAMGLLDEVSGSRIRAELFEILAEEDPVPALGRLAELDALHLVVAGRLDGEQVVSDARSVLASLRQFADALDETLDREFALSLALCARARPSEVEHWADWLRLSRKRRDAAARLAREGPQALRTLERARSLRRSEIHEIVASFAPEAVVFMHAVARKRARERIELFLRELAGVEPAVSGDDLRGMGLAPGPAYSAILDQALRDRLDGVAVGRQAELDNLRRLVQEFSADTRT